MSKYIKSKLHLEEFVKINGIDQYLFHSGTDTKNPVMLFLHGGPGSAESIFAHLFQSKWEDLYTVVHWDQRGAGKTFTKNPSEEFSPTIDILLQDLHEIIQYLKKKYTKEKIILLGHSWGSVLGSTFIKKYPNEVEYYIGVGQVISMIENEQLGYLKVKEAITKENNKKYLAKLESLGNYPPLEVNDDLFKKIQQFRKLQGKYNLAVKIDSSIIFAGFKSPIFKLSDLTAFIKSGKSNKKLFEFLWPFDLNTEDIKYSVPIYYILGDRDWQTPYTIAQEYFNKIEAPDKDIILIHDAGHMTMLDQPDLFFDALCKINQKITFKVTQ